MSSKSEVIDSNKPLVEIHVADNRISAAACGERQSRLSPEQITALQQTIISLVRGFRPPEPSNDHAGLQLESLEVQLGFKVETNAGSMLKLLLDASAEASIVAKVVWGRQK